MVVAIIGRSFSGKRRLAKSFERISKGRFRLFKQFTTRPDYNRNRHMYIPKDARDKIEDSRIFYSSIAENGHEYFSLVTQFQKGGDLIYVMDDPKSIEKIEELGVPYAVVYVDCNTAAIIRNSKSMKSKFLEVISRFTKVRGRLRKMKRAGEYNLYINTSVLSPAQQGHVMASFYHQLLDWRESNPANSHPKVLREVDHNWMHSAKETGWVMSSQ